jgi:hypothetical protein
MDLANPKAKTISAHVQYLKDQKNYLVKITLRFFGENGSTDHTHHQTRMHSTSKTTIPTQTTDPDIPNPHTTTSELSMPQMQLEAQQYNLYHPSLATPTILTS